MDFFEFVDRFEKLDVDDLFLKTMDRNPELSQLIIELIQNNQLQKGIRGDGVVLPNYSQVSVDVYGKEPGPITLKDKGDFYDSMVVIIFNGGLRTEAETEKVSWDGFVTDLEVKYGEEILDLTQESLEVFGLRLLPAFAKTMRDELGIP